jgi:hypothetical protein
MSGIEQEIWSISVVRRMKDGRLCLLQSFRTEYAAIAWARLQMEWITDLDCTYWMYKQKIKMEELIEIEDKRLRLVK